MFVYLSTVTFAPMPIKVPIYKVPIGGTDGAIIGCTMIGNPQLERLDGFSRVLFTTDDTPDYINQMRGRTGHPGGDGKTFTDGG